MRFTIFAFDIPFPANSGGRLDIWSQCLGLIAAGHVVQLWCFTNLPVDKRIRDEVLVRGICDFRTLHYLGHGTGFSRIVKKYLSPLPSCASASSLVGSERAAVLAAVRSFGPDLVVAHGIQTTGALLSLRRDLCDYPWVYRSHNDERAYYREMARAQAFGVKKAALLWQALRLSWYEPWVCGLAGAVLHISQAECARYDRTMLGRHIWVPPVYDYTPPVRRFAVRWDVGILSSWFASQKIEGLRWFVEKVLPHSAPGLRIAVAGSGAPEWLSGWCARHGIEFVGPVDSPSAFYADCSALVNPVLRGAGVNMKTMEMLATGRPVVSTIAGLAGLPPEIANWMDVADTAEDFSEKLSRAVKLAWREIPREVFDQFSASALSLRYTQALGVAKQSVA